jgi:uncharacterized repeat protein (TIGR03803 family)
MKPISFTSNSFWSRFYSTVAFLKAKTLNIHYIPAMLMVFLCIDTYAQGSWATKADLTGNERAFAASFAINSKIYLGTGADVSFATKKDFWELNTATNTWTQKADFGGSSRFGSISFVINGKGYVALGAGDYGATLYKDVWEYDPSNDTWTQLADFPGAPRQGASVFVIQNKAYIGLGEATDPNNPNAAISLTDLWEFDPSSGSPWTSKASLPAEGRFYPVAFSIGVRGYVGGGDHSQGNILTDFWQYNPVANTWSRKSDLGMGARAYVPAVTISGKAYVGSGSNADFWQYDPSTDEWTAKANNNGAGRPGSVGVAVNEKAYVGTGYFFKDFYEYTPESEAVYAGKIYGPSVGGGDQMFGVYRGVIFQASATGTGLTSIYNFDNNALTGTNPAGNVVAVNGKLFGTTPTGAASTYGVLYQLDLTGNQYSLLKEFATVNAMGSQAGLTFAGGKLYGVARGSDGFIFEYDPTSGVFTKKAAFNGTNGSDPYGNMLLVGDRLYGMTMGGGANNKGTIYEYNFRTNTIVKKADFNGTNGSEPRGGLTQHAGVLYGLTAAGGANDKGVLFEFDAINGLIIKKKDFGGSDGESPYGSLEVMNNKLYGLTSAGGSGVWGTLFEFDVPTNAYTVKVNFDNNSSVTGANPWGSLRYINGKLYGVTLAGGVNNKGVLFSYDATNGFSKIVDFDNSNGGSPISEVTFVRDNQTLSFGALTAKTIDDVPFELTATGSLGLPVRYYSSDESVATVKENAVTIVGAGTTTITAYIGQQDHFTFVNQNLVVNKKSQTITFNPLEAKTFGNANFSLAATSSSTLPVTYSSDNTNVATISGNTVTIVGAGTASIKASQAGNASFNPAADVSQSLTVAKANQVITFDALSDKTFSSANFQLSATSTSGLTVTFQTSDVGVAALAGTTAMVGNVGTTTITASQAGNSNYNAAVSVPRTLNVVKAPQSITFEALPTKKVDDAAFALTATTTFSYTPTYTSSNTSVATINGTTVTIVGAGQTNITATHGGNSNVLPADDVTRMLTVKAIQTITFSSLGSIPYKPSLELTASSNSGLSVQYTSSNPLVATISGSTATIVGIGTTTLTARQAGNDTFAPAADVAQTLTVVKANQSITFAALGSRLFGSGKFTLTATSTSGLPVTFTTLSNNVQLSAGEVTLINPGSVSITANQSGSGFYEAASPQTQTFCITPPKPTVTTSNNNSESPVLTSSAATGNQWFKNESLIVNAINQTLTVTEAGTYKVKVTVDGCSSEFSDNVPSIITGISTSQTQEQMFFYPNPVQNKLTITLSGNKRSFISIVRIDGIVTASFETSDNIVDVDVTGYSPGLYMVQVNQNQIQYIKKFVKK